MSDVLTPEQILFAVTDGHSFNIAARREAIAHIKALRQQVETLTADVALAANFFTVPLPEPGSDMARVLVANRLVRERADQAEAALAYAGTPPDTVRHFVRCVGERNEAIAHAARLERTVERTEAVVFAARALRRQCDFQVDTYKRLGGRFDDAVAGILVCRILEAVDALAALSPDHAGAPEGTWTEDGRYILPGGEPGA